MPPAVLRTVVGIGLLALSAACGSSGPTSPTATSVPPAGASAASDPPGVPRLQSL